MSAFYSALRAVVVPIVRTCWRLRSSGVERVPDRGPVILAANHLSVSDHLFLPAVCPRQVHFMAKAEYFRGRGPKAVVRARFLHAVGQIPVDRDGGRAAVAGLYRAREVLRAGNVFGIFPEGTRSPDGRLYRGRTGVARLALESDIPVLPVGLLGTDAIQPVGAGLPQLFREVEVRIGEPIDLSPYAGLPRGRQAFRSLTDEIMAGIAKLTGQELVDRYAPH